MSLKVIIGELACSIGESLTGMVCRYPGILPPPTPPEPVPPVTPKPEIRTYYIGAKNVKDEMKALGLKLMYPIPLDMTYLFTDAEGWAEVVWYIYEKYEFPDWTTDKFDCDDFAKLFWSLVSFEFGLGACGFVIGTVSGNGHAYNIIADRDGWKLFEPNPSFPWGCQPFPLNGHQYISSYVLL